MSTIALIALVQLAAGFVLASRCPRGSRRLLTLITAVGIPVAGPLLAIIPALVHGNGSASAFEEQDLEMPAEITPQEIAAVVDAAPMADRMVVGNRHERAAAIATLAKRSDRGAVSLLRWAADGSQRDLVLDAALTLSELSVVGEERMSASANSAEESPSFESLMHAAEVHADAIYRGLVDAASITHVADLARRYYQQARELSAKSRGHIDFRMARLELAAGDPEAALTNLNTATGDAEEIDTMRKQAAFAARRFDLLMSGGNLVYAT